MNAPSAIDPKVPEWRALMALALPMSLAQGGQALMGLVDTAVLGRLSPQAQGGAGLAGAFVFMVSFFGMGVMMALDPLVSQAIGAGNPQKAREHYWQGVWLSFITSVFLVVLCLPLPMLARRFGVAADVADEASNYLLWRLPGIPFTLLFVAARAYLQGQGKTRAVVAAMVLANVANLALDIVLVFGWSVLPALGSAGAAIATSLCTALQFAILSRSFGTAPVGTSRNPDFASMKKVAAVGLPIGAHLIAEAGVFTMAGFLASRLGSVSSAAHQVALSWGSFSFSFAVGIGSAAATRVGWAVGSKNARLARKVGLTAFALGALFMSACSLLFLVAPSLLARMLTQEEVVPLAVQLFVVLAVFQVSDGIQAVGAGALRGAGDTRFAFWANVVGHWLVGFPLALVLGVYGTFGVIGIWWGLSAGLTAVAIALFGRFWQVSRNEITAL
jgi:multidrug resistance protein, MATE family